MTSKLRVGDQSCQVSSFMAQRILDLYYRYVLCGFICRIEVEIARMHNQIDIIYFIKRKNFIISLVIPGWIGFEVTKF